MAGPRAFRDAEPRFSGRVSEDSLVQRQRSEERRAGRMGGGGGVGYCLVPWERGPEKRHPRERPPLPSRGKVPAFWRVLIVNLLCHTLPLSTAYSKGWATST